MIDILKSVSCTLSEELEREIMKASEGESIDIHECYEVMDIIKDVAETEKYIRESEYYEKVVEAMEAKKNSNESESYTENLHRVRDIWMSSDLTKKKQIKMDLTALMGEMTV